MEKIYEDNFVVVINKPAGILVHQDGIHSKATITDWVLKNYPEAMSVGEEQALSNGTKIFRPGIVHRLDKETSGALIICKNREAFEYFKKEFQEKNIRKVYHALVYGNVKKGKGTIEKPIGRHPTDFRRRLAEEGARGEMREAITNFEVAERSPEASFIHVFPLTGRTHQIRVHMKAINHPIICDPLYAPKKICLFGLERLALHAYKISWVGPDGKEREAIAPYPKDFEDALREFHLHVKVSPTNQT